MKKGFTTLEFVIAAVIILAFAAVFIYAFAPKLQKAPSFVEGFFPEKCALSGKTRDQYYSDITNAVSSVPPRTVYALQLNTEMKTCFSDAELPGDESKFIQGTAKTEIAKLKDATTNTEFQTVLDIYYNSKSVIPLSEWTPEDLLIFSKALFYSKGQDANKIVDLLLARKDATDAQTAEALTIKASLLQQEGKNADALNIFRQVLAKYQDKANDQTFTPFVGRAMYVVGTVDSNNNMKIKGLELLGDAIFPQSSSKYNYDYAAFYQYILTYENNKQNTALLFESFFKDPDSVFYKDAASAYSQIDNKLRTIKDCSIKDINSKQCVCKGTIITAKSCSYICKNIGGCSIYDTEALCNNDPCSFRQDYGDSVTYCRWTGNKCKYYSPDMS